MIFDVCDLQRPDMWEIGFEALAHLVERIQNVGRHLHQRFGGLVLSIRFPDRATVWLHEMYTKLFDLE